MLTLLLYITLFLRTCHATDGREDWVTIEQLQIFQDSANCSKSCIRDVNRRIWDVEQNTTCRSRGCVCSDSTEGPNFVNGRSNVTDCTRQACQQQSAIVAADKLFSDLCLVQAQNQTLLPPEPGKIFRLNATGYTDLTDCAKFLLNGCLDEDGNRNERKCAPRNKPDKWEEYKGVADSRKCRTFDCLCNGANFNATYDAIHDAGLRYCSMRISVKSNPDQESDSLDDVLALACAGGEFPPSGFSWTYNGVRPDSVSNNKISKEGWVQIGLNAFMALLTIVMIFFSTSQFVITRRKAKEKKKASTSQ